METFDGMDDVERALQEASVVAELRSHTGGRGSPKIATEESSIRGEAYSTETVRGDAKEEATEGSSGGGSITGGNGSAPLGPVPRFQKIGDPTTYPWRVF